MPTDQLSNKSKLQFKRDRTLPQNFGIWVKPIAGLLVLTSLLFFGFTFIQGSDAGQFHVDNPVGADLMVKTSPGDIINDSGESAESYNSEDPSPYPQLNRYQVGSVVPRESRQTIINDKGHKLKYVKHEVKEGENIWKIAQRYGLNTYTIVSANYEVLSERDYLPVGTELKIPNRNGILTELKKNQTLWDLMQTYGRDHEAVLKFNGIKSASHISRGEKIFIPDAHPVNPYKYQLNQSGTSEFSWPVSPGRRRITSRFGNRDHPIFDRVIFHRGMDIGAKAGSAVFASRAGIVKYAGKRSGYGNIIVLRHGDEYKTVYAHLRRTFVRKGQYVQKGQRIGEIGETGHTTGPNLHFEVRNNSKALDPLKFLE